MKTKLLLPFLFFSCFASAQYTKLLDFAGTLNGSYPNESLISDGTFLYGMTHQGGTSNFGTIFKIMPDGSGYSNLHNFIGYPTDGAWPLGSLIANDSFLYGMTQSGGINGDGTIFKIKPDGTGYTKLLDFSSAINGQHPQGSLIADSLFLYGMTGSGVFRIKKNGTGDIVLLNFTGPNGGNAYGSLISDGIFLYGMTYAGGLNGLGVVFKIKTDGTGYSKLLDFAGALNGSYPWGNLYFDGTFLYGMTTYGGINDLGVVFKIKTDGTGYIKLLDFNSTNGAYPNGSLISDGTFLYGIPGEGGTNGQGTIFKIMLNGTGYTNLFDFNSTDGTRPYGSLISDGTFFYGMTTYGGINDMGVIFKFQDSTTTNIQNISGNSNFTISPNPTSGIFTIQVGNGQLAIGNEYKIEIVNVLGEQIQKLAIGSKQLATNSQITLDFSSQPSGIYFVKVKTEKGVTVKKIVKE